MVYVWTLFEHHTVHFYASVGTHSGTRGTADASFRLRHIRKVIASVVDVLGLQVQYIGRTCHHTEVTPFAALFVNSDCSFYFCHKFIIMRG